MLGDELDAGPAPGVGSEMPARGGLIGLKAADGKLWWVGGDGRGPATVLGRAWAGGGAPAAVCAEADEGGDSWAPRDSQLEGGYLVGLGSSDSLGGSPAVRTGSESYCAGTSAWSVAL